MREQLGVDVTMLRCLSSVHDERHRIVSRLYAAENHSLRWAAPNGARWVDRDDLDGLRLS